MENRPLRDNFKYEYPNTGFNRTAHHESLEKWGEQAEKEIKRLSEQRDELVMSLASVILIYEDTPINSEIVDKAKKLLVKIKTV